MRNSYPGLKAELIPTASRFSDPSGKRTSGWCSRSRCAGLSFTALLLFAAFLYYQLRVLQNGSHIVGAAEQIVKISLQGNKQQPVSASPSTQSTSAAAQQLLHTLLGPFLSSTAELEVPSRPLTQLLAQQRPCPNNCSGVGNCLGDLGVCQCPGAWRGADCSEPKQRPCTDRFAPPGSDKPQSHVDAEGRDLNLTTDGWLFGRCSGICDLEYGHCYCPPVGKYGRINPPPGAPPGTPAIKEGRPLAHPCKAPSVTADGRPIPWGTPGLTWDQLYGPKGWCVADVVDNNQCSCQMDGWDGPGCSIRTESVCLNQCSRRGVCHQRGFCKCQPGWYGIDCAHPSSPEAAMQAPSAGTHPWLQHTSVDAWQCDSSGTGCLEDAVLSIFKQNPLLSQQPTGDSSRSSSIQPPKDLRPPQEDAAATNTSASNGTNNSSSSSSSSNATSLADGATTPPVRPSRRRRALAEGAPTGVAHIRPAAAAAAANSSSQAAVARRSKRRRPLIYIYNGPGEVNSHVLQYRDHKGTCTWRQWVHGERGNQTELVGEITYATEGFLPELLMGSRHRTLDPEEADYFLVPVLSACYMTHVSATHDFPWFYRPTHRRIKGASVMYWHALNWVRTHYPFWNSSRGADHIWIFPHDEGACWAPQEVYENSIILSHWGRNTSDNLPSHTQYRPDNYTHADDAQDDLLPVPYTQLIGRHRCYTPGKDLVLPVLKMPSHYKDSPYITGKQPPRDILGFHKGRMGTEPAFGPSFSLGVRQTVARVAEQDDWAKRYNIHVGSRGSVTGVYSQLLARSVFCLVLQGEGWTARFDDAILHGCIPVIVIQDTVGPWGSELDWESFSLRISPQNISNIPSILAAVPPSSIASMQAKLEQIWHRFAWLSHPLIAQEVNEIQKRAGVIRHRAKGRRALADTNSAPGGVLQGEPKLTIPRIQHDAFHSLMQVLASWLPHRGAAAARQAAQQQQQQQSTKQRTEQQQQSPRVITHPDGQPSGLSPGVTTEEQQGGSGQAPGRQQQDPPHQQQQQQQQAERSSSVQEQKQQHQAAEKPPVT